MRTMLDVSAAVAEADGGTAWVVTLLNVCAWLTGLFPSQAQDDVFKADPDALVSGVLAPTAEVTRSRSRAAGGSPAAGTTTPAPGTRPGPCSGSPSPTSRRGQGPGGGPDPARRHEVEDTWFVAGMKSSGSNCLVAQDVFVPEHRRDVGPGRDRGPLRHRAHRRGVLPLRAGADPRARPRRSAAGHGPRGPGPGAAARPPRSRSPTRSSRRRPTRSPSSCRSPRPRC